MAERVRIDEAGMRDLEGQIAAYATKIALAVSNQAKRLAPVDTGRLRSSITYEVVRESSMRGVEIVARVGTNVHYAAHLEFGTRRMRARPYLRPALGAARTVRP